MPNLTIEEAVIVRCNDCHDSEGHFLTCPTMPLEDQVAGWKEAWQMSVNRERATAASRMKMQYRLLEQVTFWQGKFRMVAHENNKLRRATYRSSKEE